MRGALCVRDPLALRDDLSYHKGSHGSYGFAQPYRSPGSCGRARRPARRRPAPAPCDNRRCRFYWPTHRPSSYDPPSDSPHPSPPSPDILFLLKWQRTVRRRRPGPARADRSFIGATNISRQLIPVKRLMTASGRFTFSLENNYTPRSGNLISITRTRVMLLKTISLLERCGIPKGKFDRIRVRPSMNYIQADKTQSRARHDRRAIVRFRGASGLQQKAEPPPAPQDGSQYLIQFTRNEY
ncbi:hypothetical protein EVAR_27698_1 [Eumeta japonica]|uniref:Uncharacterized protein n=1 Tax=Eumeta variegata TaxID=151549 RepID=A0A4C1WRK2_EUMVA|nr:hypothetical protein EVAR_27698_1 [Eumeta japonica]